MNTLEIYLQQPNNIAEAGSEEFTNIIKRYPYFATPYMLLAKQSAMLHQVSAPYLLNKAAVYSPERRALKKFMTTPLLIGKKSEQVYAPKIEVSDTSDTQPLPVDLVEESILIKESNHQPEIPVLQLNPDSEKPVLLPTPSVQELNPDSEKDNKQPFEGSFLEWLQFLRANDVPFSIPVPELQYAISYEAALQQETNRLSPQIPLVTREEENVTKPSANGEEKKVSDLAKESLLEDREMVTETLAKIYVLQKKYDKAKDAYEKLILKFPEKKAFFATQIEKIAKR